MKDPSYRGLLEEELRRRSEHILALERALPQVAHLQRQREMILMLVFVDQTVLKSIEGELEALPRSH